MTEQSRKCGSCNHSRGGQQYRFAHYRLHGFPSGAETAVEHNHNQGNGAQVFGKDLIVQVHGDGSHIAEDDTQKYESEEGRYPYFR